MVATAADFEGPISRALRRWRRHPHFEDFAQDARLAVEYAIRDKGDRMNNAMAYVVARRAAVDAWRVQRVRERVRHLDDPSRHTLTAMLATPEADLPRPLVDVIDDHILYALEFAKGNIPIAAEVLGIGRATLYRRIKNRRFAAILAGESPRARAGTKASAAAKVG